MYRTCIWQPLRHQNKQVCRRISSSATRHNQESGEKEKNSDGTGGKKDGFFSRFKQELMSEFEKNDSMKKPVDEIQKVSSTLRGYLKKVTPERKGPDPNAETVPLKPSFSERVASIREMLDKEKLAEKYEKVAQQAKDKSTQSYEQASQWKANYYAKKQEEKEAAAAEPPKESKIKKKFSQYMESSGLSENVYISQAQKETENMKKKLSTSVAEQMADLSKKFSEGKSSVEESDFLKKSKEALEQSEKLAKEALEQSEKLAKEASERLAKEKEELIKSEKLQKISEVTADTVKTAAEDFYDPVRLKESEAYKRPETLKMRIEEEDLEKEEEKKQKKEQKIDTETTGVTMHKGWKWETSWKNFKDTNPVVQKFMEIREKLEESDNLFARAGYKMVDFVANSVSKMTTPTEVSKTIEEIQKMDPKFDINQFSATLRFDILPSVLEAYLQGNAEILENWSQERAMGQFKHMLASRTFTGTIQLIDIGECEIITGAMLELGPVFMLNVATQQLYTERTKKSVENGEPQTETQEVIKRVVYTIAVCRDQSMFDPTSAWTILEIVEHVTNESFY